MSENPVTGGCNRCGTRWAGFAVAHCARCHETFSTVGNFDRHQQKPRGVPSGDLCQWPQDMGLVRMRREGSKGGGTEVWAMPAPLSGNVTERRTGGPEGGAARGLPEAS